MSAVLWSRSGSFEFDASGEPAVGAKAYFYNSGTSTPRTVYTDSALNVPHAHPVAATGNGRWPAVYLPFGDYKYTLKTAGGTTLISIDGISNDEPTDPTDTIDPKLLLTTGDVWFSFLDAARAGAVRCNGRTIGSAASGATERANADTETLYALLWNNLSNSVCPVSTGRGASASADFAANKNIGLPDARGKVLGGLDTMGNAAAGLFDASVPFIIGNATTAGSVAGVNHHVLTAAQMAAHTHPISITSGAGGTHTHTVDAGGGLHTHTGTTDSDGADHQHVNNISSPTSIAATAASGGAVTGLWQNASGFSPTGSATAYLHTHTFTIGSSGTHIHTLSTQADHTHLISGNSGSAGIDAAHNNLQRTVLGTWFIKL